AREHARAQLEAPPAAIGDGPAPLVAVSELAAPLRLCHRSLVETHNEVIAAGRLTDILRRVAAFGLTLARLDIRQESSRHAEAVEWIARRRRLGAYADATEQQRAALLLGALDQRAPPIADGELADAPDTVR